MVSLNGAIAAEPIVAQIETLQAAVTELTNAINGGGFMWQFALQVYTNNTSQQSATSSLVYNLSVADTQAILNDIKNILNNDINILTNTLGAIS